MINQIIKIAKNAGKIILEHYNQPVIEFTKKADNSELTLADLASHELICQSLHKLFSSIPILSEESAEQYSYDIRKNWEQFFLVDPLDGTKEFIQHNGEFTVNIALIQNNFPVLGVIHVPVSGVTYYAEKGKGAYKIKNDETTPLFKKINTENTLRVAVSRSHLSQKTQEILNELGKTKKIVIVRAGSALKFGLVGEGSADVYVRNAPTMEWDTAAGQIIVNEVGKDVRSVLDNEILKYNKLELLNPGFIVQ